MTFKLTDLGKLLEAQLAAGSKPIITRIEGSDAYSSNPEALLAVQDVKQTLQVEAVTVVDGKSHLKFILSNIGLNEEYYLKQIGIYAKQTEDSEEILYFIGQDRNGERIPAISEKEVEFEYDLTITVDNAYEVTVAVSGNDFARKEMLEKKIDGNGGDISETVIAATAESEAEYPVPAAGDSTKTAFGKIIKFFGDLRNWMTGVCLLGQIVNNCVTNRSDLPLSAAMGKQLQDAITVLNTNQKKGIIDQDNIGTLKSPSQLTHNGFYAFEYCSADVNSNLDNGAGNFTDYNTGDFRALLIAEQWNSNGCRFGTLIVTSPRFVGKLWIGRIWEFRFTHWHKVAGT